MIIFVLFCILAFSIALALVMDYLCFLMFYHSMKNGDNRKWNTDIFSYYSREFHIIEKGIHRTIISNRYEQLTIPTKWIYRESHLSLKNYLE